MNKEHVKFTEHCKCFKEPYGLPNSLCVRTRRHELADYALNI